MYVNLAWANIAFFCGWSLFMYACKLWMVPTCVLVETLLSQYGYGVIYMYFGV